MLPSKLAFVDIETTGLGVTRDRVIEIGILRVEHNILTKTFHSLINPEGYASPFSLELTGIKPEDLEKAPTFYELIQEIEDILEGCTFVAHNVRFDYGFIRNEFKRYQKKFFSKHFCTVKLSRELFPRWKSHNLDSLIRHLTISCEKRHRAFDDAKVLWDFYQVVQQKFDATVIEDALTKISKKPSLPTTIPSKTIEILPDTPGVYIFYAKDGNPLYVGKSVNVKERVISHFVNDHTSGKEMHIAQQVYSIEAIPTAGELGALIKESQLIKKLQPLYNRQLRTVHKLYVLKKRVRENNYPEIYLEMVQAINPNDLLDIVGVFRSKKQAKEFLIPLVKEFSLCEKLLGLEKTKSACFAYRLNQCKGACVQKENPLAYTMRFAQAFAKRSIKPWPFSGPIIISEENFLDEKSEYFVVDKWCLLSQQTFLDTQFDQMKSSEYAFDLDTYKLLMRFLEKKKNWKKVKQLPQKVFTATSEFF